MNEQQERSAFERWASDDWTSPNAVLKDSDGIYKLMSMQQQWRAWQARAALALETNDDAQIDPCVVLWQAMNAAGKVGNRTDDKLIVKFLLEAGYCIAAIAAPAPEAEPCIYPACQTNGCREACEAPAQAQQSDRDAFMAGYEAAQADAKVCDLPPLGWRCTRTAGHEGPCAAVEAPEDADLVAKGMERLREAPAQAQQSMTHELQQQCSDWGVYWRASDAHGVDLSMEQAEELLRRALGVEVAIAKAKPEAQQPLKESQLDTVTQNHWSAIRTDAMAAHRAFANPMASHRSFGRAVERACAEAWGVKLAGQGKEASNAG